MLVDYPTDGVVAIRGDGTSAKKLKGEKAIELSMMEDGSLCTSDGDTVVRRYPQSETLRPWNVVELKFTLAADGRTIDSQAAFRRVDKRVPNGTGAVMGVLGSCGTVRRDDEARRRAVLMWCDTLRERLFRRSSPEPQFLTIVLADSQRIFFFS